MKKIYLSSTIIPLFAAAEFISHDKILAAFIALGFAAVILLRMEISTPDEI